MIDAWNRLRQLGSCEAPRGDLATRQSAWLLKCISRNQETEYGRMHGFSRIRSPRDFQAAVPLVAYEDLAPLILRAAAGESDVLFRGVPAAFERTGGSSSGAKLIPYSTESFADFRCAILPWLANLIEAEGLKNGCAYWAISPATRQPEYTPSGIPIGLPDGAYLGMDALMAFGELSAAPPWVGTIPSVADWQLATLYWLVRREDLELVSVWSPTFFLTLIDAITNRRAELEQLLRHGADFSGQAFAPDAGALSRLTAYAAGQEPRTLWPHLKLVSCWSDGSSRPFFEQLRARLPQAHFEGKGLLATEGIVTAPDRLHRPRLAADSGFFEFLDENAHPWLAHELSPGQHYEVVMTTAGGLYRYRIGDRVRCDGYADDAPILRFVGRAGWVSDLVGEKLTEDFVAGCLFDLPGFCMLTPIIHPQPGYILVADRNFPLSTATVAAIEERLSQNPQYAYARRMHQLAPLSICPVAHPLETYIDRALEHGARLGDIKVPALHPAGDWLNVFSESPL